MAEFSVRLGRVLIAAGLLLLAFVVILTLLGYGWDEPVL